MALKPEATISKKSVLERSMTHHGKELEFVGGCCDGVAVVKFVQMIMFNIHGMEAGDCVGGFQ